MRVSWNGGAGTVNIGKASGSLIGHSFGKLMYKNSRASDALLFLYFIAQYSCLQT